MVNTSFQFKKFKVCHDRCAMKVGTDGVILGAWTSMHGIANAVDAGTGSGLIALMLAQRSETLIDGVEIDGSSYQQALENVSHSPWSDRIRLYHQSIQQFAVDHVGSYDLVVSNPPFFRNSLLPLDQTRTIARHNTRLRYEDLIMASEILLHPKGRMAVILPAVAFDAFSDTAFLHGFFPSRIMYVRSHPQKEPARCMAEWVRERPANCIRENMTLTLEDGMTPSAEYRSLTCDFYLKY